MRVHLALSCCADSGAIRMIYSGIVCREKKECQYFYLKYSEFLDSRYEDVFLPLLVVVCEKRRAKEKTVWLNTRW